MQFIKYSILLISTFLMSPAFSYSDKDCLNQNFKIQIENPKTFLGFSNKLLIIEKKLCVISIDSENYKFLKKKWLIDVCREPVHIKEGNAFVNVIKKRGNCPDKHNKSFCNMTEDILNTIQDDGLVFANGEKENLNEDHGKTYCAYNVIRNYLNDAKVYSRYEGPVVHETSAVEANVQAIQNQVNQGALGTPSK